MQRQGEWSQAANDMVPLCQNPVSWCEKNTTHTSTQNEREREAGGGEKKKTKAETEAGIRGGLS